MVRRAQQRRQATSRGRRSLPGNFPYSAILRALRKHPSAETEAFFDEVLASVKKDYKVDNKRIYVTGHSNGGSFTYILWAVRDDWCKGELDFIGNDPQEDAEFKAKAKQFPEGLLRLSRPMRLEAPENSANPRDEFTRIEGLREIIVRT